MARVCAAVCTSTMGVAPLTVEYQLQTRGSGLMLANIGLAGINDPFILDTDPVTPGALVLTWAEPQPLDGSQLMFVDGIASLAAQALIRARRFTDERAVAVVLQQAVMPEELPPVPGLDVGAT